MATTGMGRTTANGARQHHHQHHQHHRSYEQQQLQLQHSQLQHSPRLGEQQSPQGKPHDSPQQQSSLPPDDTSAEDVADFLQRIRSLSDRRNREDEERTRKLEQDILEGRRLREARRAERARSLSPTKDSPLHSSPSSRPTSRAWDSRPEYLAASPSSRHRDLHTPPSSRHLDRQTSPSPRRFDLQTSSSPPKHFDHQTQPTSRTFDLHAAASSPQHFESTASYSSRHVASSPVRAPTAAAPSSHSSYPRPLSRDALMADPLEFEPSRPKPPSPGTGLARSGTLSWQQRPVSRDSNADSNSRPTSRRGLGPDSSPSRPHARTGPPALSVADSTSFSIDRAQTRPHASSAFSSSPERPTAPSPANAGFHLNDRSRVLPQTNSQSSLNTPTRDLRPASSKTSLSERAQALEHKEPAWFRQTADRGLTSAAYRKTDESQTLSAASSVRLPSMASSASETRGPRGNAMLSESSPALMAARQSLPSQQSSPHPSMPLSGNKSGLPAPKSEEIGKSTSKMDLSPPEVSRNSFSTNPARPMNLTSDGIERPPSPTKGLGGFVESAMLKRTDSLNKRGGVQSPATRRGLPTSPPEPSNSQSSTPLLPTRTKPDVRPLDLSKASAASDVLASRGEPASSEDNRRSPDRIGDASKKWSPTKSTWLDSALTKTDAPKPKPYVSPQPSWKVDREKAVQREAESDGPSKAIHHEVSVGGLMRSSPALGSIKSPSSTEASTSIPSWKVSKVPVAASPPRSPTSATRIPRRPSLSSPARRNSDIPDAPSGSSSPSRVGNSPSLIPARSPSFSKKGSSLKSPGTLGSVAASSTKLSTVPKDKTPPQLKPKPAQPAATDLRAGLKARTLPIERNDNAEPEFKAVFGKLKRTQTQNYVAPDHLKNNILRGKAGLAQTDGPQKSQRVDEFKESIQRKREQMQSSSGSIRLTSKPSQSNEPTMPAKPLARTGLGSASLDTRIATSSANEKADDLARIKSSKPSEASAAPSNSAPAKALTNNAKPSSSILPTKLKSSAESTLPSSGANAKPVLPVPEKKTSAPARLQESSSETSRLADRFNPALAGILARQGGMPPGASRASTAPVPAEPSREVFKKEEPESGPSLTHATKGRARGPKRRLPTTATPGPVNTPGGASAQMRDALNSETIPSARPRPSPLPLNGALKNSQAPPASSQVVLPPSSNETSEERVSPTQSASVSAVLARSKKIGSDSVSERHSRPMPLSNLKDANSKLNGSSRSESPPKQSIPPLPKPTTITTAASPPLPAKSSPRVPPKRDFSNGLKTDDDVALEDAAAKQSSRTESKIKQQDTKASADTLREPERTRPQSSRQPSPSAKKPNVGNLPTRTAVAEPSPEISRSDQQTRHAREVIREVFGDRSQVTNKIEVNVQPFLARGDSDPEKIQTIRRDIWEMTGDGKRTPLAAQKEHILFEANMYLCTHVFNTPAGKRVTEAYLWCGDGVAPSAIEDAQLFAKNAAKEAGAKLQILGQGKEPSNFFEALGGIVITRQGSSSETSAATYMLCGRRHMGHVAFDQVPFAASSLCSGFPFIVAATNGILYLWKGRGASAEEMGCARLIGMDLGLLNEIEEIDEGAEPRAFWQALQAPGPVVPQVPHWQAKARHDRHRTRLFGVDTEARPRSAGSFIWRRPSTGPGDSPAIREISPYRQRDLDPHGIFILDTFFEMFIIVGQQAAAKYDAFRAAVMFAHEYGMLAASQDDRPTIPSGTIIFDEVLPAMRHAFRKWDDALVPTGPIAAGRFSGGSSFKFSARTLSLSAALEALNSDS